MAQGTPQAGQAARSHARRQGDGDGDGGGETEAAVAGLLSFSHGCQFLVTRLLHYLEIILRLGYFPMDEFARASEFLLRLSAQDPDQQDGDMYLMMILNVCCHPDPPPGSRAGRSIPRSVPTSTSRSRWRL